MYSSVEVRVARGGGELRGGRACSLLSTHIIFESFPRYSVHEALGCPGVCVCGQGGACWGLLWWGCVRRSRRNICEAVLSPTSESTNTYPLKNNIRNPDHCVYFTPGRQELEITIVELAAACLILSMK